MVPISLAEDEIGVQGKLMDGRNYPSFLSECSTSASGAVASCTDDELEAKEKAAQVQQFAPFTAVESTIIFDWDDTLLPISFIQDAVRICPQKVSVGPGRPRPGRPSRHPRLQQDFPCYEALVRHGELVRQLLTRARSAGQVAIVTLAERPWVFESAEMYLPGLNLPGLLQDLQIPIYYALEHHGRDAAAVAAGAAGALSGDEGVVCKRNAMAEFLSRPAEGGGCTGRQNVLSVGDSFSERDATRALLCSRAGLLPQAQFCKTLKLMSEPSLKALSDQLRHLAAHLELFVSHKGDLDLLIDSPEEIAAAVASLSSSQ